MSARKMPSNSSVVISTRNGIAGPAWLPPEPVCDGLLAPVSSQAYRSFCALTALTAETAASSRPTPIPTAMATMTRRVTASRPPLTASRRPRRITVPLRRTVMFRWMGPPR